MPDASWEVLHGLAVSKIPASQNAAVDKLATYDAEALAMKDFAEVMSTMKVFDLKHLHKGIHLMDLHMHLPDCWFYWSFSFPVILPPPLFEGGLMDFKFEKLLLFRSEIINVETVGISPGPMTVICGKSLAILTMGLFIA